MSGWASTRAMWKLPHHRGSHDESGRWHGKHCPASTLWIINRTDTMGDPENVERESQKLAGLDADSRTSRDKSREVTVATPLPHQSAIPGFIAPRLIKWTPMATVGLMVQQTALRTRWWELPTTERSADGNPNLLYCIAISRRSRYQHSVGSSGHAGIGGEGDGPWSQRGPVKGSSASATILTARTSPKLLLYGALVCRKTAELSRVARTVLYDTWPVGFTGRRHEPYYSFPCTVVDAHQSGTSGDNEAAVHWIRARATHPHALGSATGVMWRSERRHDHS
nr:hypothetical protein CFP56_30125 [Quercus suber]